jgi:hypothetical protein
MGKDRVGIVQSVTVRRELAGQVITMRDRVQRRTDPISPPGTASFGIVSYDDRAGKFLMRSYFRGQITDLDAEVPRAGILIGRTTRPDLGEGVRDRHEAAARQLSHPESHIGAART